MVRTVAATAAKAGAKAVILPDGTISEGWIGGGCARAAVLKAAREALADGKSRLVSVQPPDVLQEQGVAAGEERDGVRFAKNMCPSQGTMDIFVEPVLPRPEIVVCGSSPVAVALADLGRRLGFAHHRLRAGGGAGGVRRGRPADRGLCAAGRASEGARYIVVSTRAAATRRRCRRRWRSSRLCRLRRQPQEGGGAEGQARDGGRRRRAARRAEGAGRPRPRRDHAGGDRAVDPRRDRGDLSQGKPGAR